MHEDGHCPNKVDDIEATDQCNSSAHWRQVSKVQTVLDPVVKAILPKLTKCVFSKAENWGRFL